MSAERAGTAAGPDVAAAESDATGARDDAHIPFSSHIMASSASMFRGPWSSLLLLSLACSPPPPMRTDLGVGDDDGDDDDDDNLDDEDMDELRRAQ